MLEHPLSRRAPPQRSVPSGAKAWIWEHAPGTAAGAAAVPSCPRSVSPRGCRSPVGTQRGGWASGSAVCCSGGSRGEPSAAPGQTWRWQHAKAALSPQHAVPGALAATRSHQVPRRCHPAVPPSLRSGRGQLWGAAILSATLQQRHIFKAHFVMDEPQQSRNIRAAGRSRGWFLRLPTTGGKAFLPAQPLGTGAPGAPQPFCSPSWALGARQVAAGPVVTAVAPRNEPRAAAGDARHRGI